MPQSPKTPPAQKNQVGILVVVFCVAAVVTVNIARNYLSGPAGMGSNSRSKGNPSAPFKIKEYIDFQCPACAKGAGLLAQYMKAYPDKIHLEMHYFPLEQMHIHAMRSARYAECAARQGKFWPFQDQLISKQAEWRGLLNADPYFQQIARDLKLDLLKLEACLTGDDAKRVIEADKDDGTALGIQSTPTYFINGKMFVGTKTLEDELKSKVGELPSPGGAAAQGTSAIPLPTQAPGATAVRPPRGSPPTTLAPPATAVPMSTQAPSLPGGSPLTP